MWLLLDMNRDREQLFRVVGVVLKGLPLFGRLASRNLRKEVSRKRQAHESKSNDTWLSLENIYVQNLNLNP